MKHQYPQEDYPGQNKDDIKQGCIGGGIMIGFFSLCCYLLHLFIKMEIILNK